MLSPAWTRWGAVASVLIVAGVAAVVSYCHMQHLADQAGEQWRSFLIPLSVDGMLVASTLAIVDRRRAGLSAGWVPWLGLALGILASLAANVAAARPDPIARIIAAWPPLAFAVAVETLVIVLRGTRLGKESNVQLAIADSTSGGRPTGKDGGEGAKAGLGSHLLTSPPSLPRTSVPDSPVQGAKGEDAKKAAAAERSRRARRHKVGDHSMCLPANCPFVTNGVKVEVPSHAH